jgi:hypothetical protein
MNERIDIINHIISKYNFKNYLEIGVRDLNDCFNKIICENKESVDPGYEVDENLATYKMTSDDFFKNLSDNKLNKKWDYTWDVIFIDGLHYAYQVERDIMNSLKHLSGNGIIVIHDCNPPDEYHARSDYYDFSTPAKGSWNGSVWKAIYEIRRSRTDLDCCTINKDYGVSLIRRGKQKLCDIENKFFDWHIFEKNREKILNLIEIEEYDNWLNNPFYL